MKVKKLISKLKKVSPDADVLFFDDKLITDEKGKKLLPGIGVFDSGEFIYIGEVNIIKNEEL